MFQESEMVAGFLLINDLSNHDIFSLVYTSVPASVKAPLTVRRLCRLNPGTGWAVL